MYSNQDTSAVLAGRFNKVYLLACSFSKYIKHPRPHVLLLSQSTMNESKVNPWVFLKQQGQACAEGGESLRTHLGVHANRVTRS